MIHENLESTESVSEYSKHTTAVDWIEMGYRGVIESQQQAFATPGHIVDYGCGPGFFAAYIAQEFNQQVIGVDISAEMVSHCETTYTDDNTRFHQVSDNSLSFISDNSIDGVVSCYVLMQISCHDEQIAVAKEIHRVLKPGAKFTVLTMNPAFTGSQFDFIRNGESDKTYAAGEAMTTRLTTEHGALNLEDVYWPKEHYINALVAGGFSDVTTKAHAPAFGEHQDKAQFLVISGVKA